MASAAPKTPFDVRTRVDFNDLSQPGQVLGYRTWLAYLFMCEFERKTGRAPDYDEICAGAGVGTKGEVSRIVKALSRRGLVALNEAGGGRGITRIKSTANC